MKIIKYFTAPYKNDNQHLRVKAEITAVMLTLILITIVLELVSAIFLNQGQIPGLIAGVIGFLLVLILLRKKHITMAGNLFVLAGLFKLIEYFPYQHSYQFFLQSFLGMLVCISIYLKPYQLWVTFIYTITFNIYRMFYLYHHNVSVDSLYFHEALLSTIGVIFFAIGAFFYDKIINEEIVINLKTKQLSETDPLTQLGNRSLFEQTMYHYIHDDKEFNLALVDIDGFKQFNDTYGHQIGDKVLVLISALLKETFHEHAYRWGGEEFAIIGLDQTFYQRLLYIKEAIQDMDFGLDHHVTVSIGCIDASHSTYDVIFKNVDQALYKAKDEGRNRIVCKESL